MPIDLTRVKDALIPDVWNKYFDELTAELSEIIKSGIVAPLQGISIPSEGKTMNLPFWGDLSGNSDVWTTGQTISPDAIKAKKDVAVILTRVKAFGTEDLVKVFSGSDPMGSIVRKFAAYWSRDDQATLLSILKGIFGWALKDNLLDKSDQPISDPLIVQALNKLGDASQKITGIIMHSAVRSDLFIKRLISTKSTEPGSDTAPEFGKCLGRKVIEDDGVPVENVGGENVYTTYLFGDGAVGTAAGTPDNAIEIVREGLKSQDSLIHRRQFILHPRGLAWKGSSALDTPTNAELATAANWERVFELKNIPIVALKHKIG